MDEKICYVCNVKKPLVDFYKSKNTTDGFLGKCKKCTNEYGKTRYFTLKESNPEWLEKERARARAKNHKNKGRYKIEPEAKKRYMEKYLDKYPERKAAASAIVMMTRKNPDSTRHFHHWSYNKEHWKDVIEISVDDHYKLHRFLRYDQAAMMYKTMDGILLDTREKHIEYMQKVIAI